MALIVITIAGGGNGDVEVGLLTEPAIPESATLTPAQVVALDMVAASTRESPVKEDRGLIQLLG
jgi:hypothetical protein